MVRESQTLSWTVLAGIAPGNPRSHWCSRYKCWAPVGLAKLIKTVSTFRSHLPTCHALPATNNFSMIFQTKIKSVLLKSEFLKFNSF